MFISISVLRAYWYSGVPSSSTVSCSKNTFDSSRASFGATLDGSAISGTSTLCSAVCTVVVMMRPSRSVGLVQAGPSTDTLANTPVAEPYAYIFRIPRFPLGSVRLSARREPLSGRHRRQLRCSAMPN